MQHSQWAGNGKAIALHGAHGLSRPDRPALHHARTANGSFCRAFGLPPCDLQQPRPPFHFARSQLHEATLTGSRHSTIPSTPDHPQMQCRVQPCTCSPQANHQSNKQTAQQRPPIAPFAQPTRPPSSNPRPQRLPFAAGCGRATMLALFPPLLITNPTHPTPQAPHSASLRLRSLPGARAN